jgi:predicted ATPase/DNA-binding SARP family transcriptional activator/DNA-binding CsgD family transcriptional regulator
VALRLYLLGAFRVVVDGRVVERATSPRRKVAALLKLLALAPRRTLHVDQVLDTLWPDLPLAAARNNLHHTLHLLRRALDGGPLRAIPATYVGRTRDLLALSPAVPVWTDVEAFETAAAAARRTPDPAAYEAALALYAGDLLPEDRFEDWAAPRREVLRDVYVQLLHELADRYEARGDLQPAIVTLNRLVAAEPAHEPAHVGLMRLYAASGQRHLAMRQYRHLAEAVRRELDTDPEPASQRLYQAIVAGRFPAPVDGAPITLLAPSPKTLQTSEPDARPNNLPALATSFVGRKQEVADLAGLLAEQLAAATGATAEPPTPAPRLLTLTGTGGAGKTRLALQVAATLRDAHPGLYPDGIWLVELAALTDSALVPQALATVVGVRESQGRPLLEVLAAALRPKRSLVILDNCEHLLDASAHLAATLLRACLHLRLLATSREPLGVAGEALWPVPPLALPDADRLPPLDDLAQFDAVRLFLERARAGRHSFALTPQNAAAVAHICRRLDGLPLALELAAARIQVLAAEQIAVRLDDRFRLLAISDRTGPPRHQRLRALVDWSHDLLSDQQRALFARLSVFAGTFTIEAAEAVAADDGALPLGGHDGVAATIPAPDVLDVLAHLVDKSLVAVSEVAGEARYRLLETLREYARERLAERQEVEVITRRHAAYFLARAEAAAPELEGPQQVACFGRLAVEHDDYRAALRRTLDSGDSSTALRLGQALYLFWYARGYQREGRAWLEAALAAAGDSAPAAARGAGLVAAAALARAQGDRRRALVWNEEGLRLARATGEPLAIAIALVDVGHVTCDLGDLARAEAALAEGLALYRAMGNWAGEAQALHCLGRVALRRGDEARAAVLFEQDLAIARELGRSRHVAIALNMLAQVAARQGKHARATGLAAEGLLVRRDLQDRRGAAEGLEILAGVAAATGQPARAARWFGAAESLREATGSVILPAHRPAHDDGVAAARAPLDRDAFAAAWREGGAMTLEQIVDDVQAAVRSAPPDKGAPMPAATGVPKRLASGARPASLTVREREVAVLAARGMSNRQIATELGISERTAEAHVARILTKLGLASRSDVAPWAVAQRLLPARAG